MIVTATIKQNNEETVGVLVANPKQFQTGSQGFWGTGKITMDGKRYQAQLQLVEIGSKAAAAAAEDQE